ncbi:tetratricopeptide repeat-containing sensor histidine kinase [Pedobacter rhizosphaerae]|uniref:Histidine kinase/HSP90-like ATPase domain-containing protein n=1 Tax=Pedobacter rhizosphaerae TaxID=390241 RepID=A0A1H9L8A1_9SPHI|nr:tetratricopeptide repeat-containing sensor histidine kinase [Pedobacter rhizosphaerae]SER07644.1 hypothetical protein SAMN04488023_10439 [Pedobacter rhizosphaerae]
MKRFLLYILLLSLLSCSQNKAPNKSLVDNPFYNKAFDFKDQNKPDSALAYFNRAKEFFNNQNDSLGIGKCLINTAIILTEQGDNFGGQEIALQALSYLDESNEKHWLYLGANYNNLGIATYNLKDNLQAIKFYDAAIKFSKNPLDDRMYLNNKAKSFQELKNYKAALAIYNQILNEEHKNPKEYARALSNIARTKWLENPNYNAEPEFIKALDIRKQQQDLWGLNASYSHLADYFATKNTSSALKYAHQMYEVAKNVNSPDDQLQALDKLIRLSPPLETKTYFETYQNLSDSLQTARSASENQFALIRYETEKNKADNLSLQKDNDEKKYQIILLAFAALAILTTSIIWYRKRKQKLESEAQNAIKEIQLKTSKKVHDVVANGLYRVMSEIQNQEAVDKDHVLDKIEDLYEKSRDISYEDNNYRGPDFHLKLADLLSSFATETTKILLVGNSSVLWQKINSQVKYELAHILQELMVNMKKHSRATSVAVKFEQTNHNITIYYTDNGIGISKGTSFNNGLTNTGNRIKAIKGAINFDTQTEKGLKIQITFPVA